MNKRYQPKKLRIMQVRRSGFVWKGVWLGYPFPTCRRRRRRRRI